MQKPQKELTEFTPEKKEKNKKALKRTLSGRLKTFVIGFCVFVSLVHVYFNSIGLIEVVQKNMMHISLMLAIIFLLKPASKYSPIDRPSLLDWVFFALSLALGIYLFVSYDRWIGTFLRPTTNDIIYGVIFIILVIEASRRTVGLLLTILSVIFLVYAYVGPWMPGVFAHQGFLLKRIFIRVTMTSEGILGVASMVSASYIFMFILFASFLKATGASDFFNDLATAIAGGRRGGPAKASIFASAATGTISGSAQANVATTGSFTIPLMISVGYRPYFAGAVEAIASTGGVLMPPIMGAAAFIMCSYLGLSYNTIMLAGLTPAILYYWTLFFMVDLGAVKWELTGMPKSDLPSTRTVMKERGLLIAPLVIIIFFLTIGFSPLLAAFVGIITVLTVSSIRKSTRLSFRDILHALAEGAENGAVIAVICAIIGFIIASVGMTGVGQAIGVNIVEWASGNLWLTALMCMITAVILGMGLPGPACYIITATVAAPALVQLGVPQLSAHLFAFYFGTMSAVIPPVALTSFTAGAIANADSNKIAFTGLFLGSAGLLLPYMFVFNPVLLFIDFTWQDYIPALTSALIGLYAVAIAVIGYLDTKLNIIERGIFASSTFLLISSNNYFRIAGFAVFVLVYIWSRWKKKFILKLKPAQ